MALSRYCLDTSAYSQLRRGETNVTHLISTARWIGVPTIVLGELFAGFLGGDQRARNEEDLVSFLRHPVVEEVVVDHEIASIYGEIASSLLAAGTPLPTNDLWIAACSARAGAPLVTFDAHFRSIGRIGTILLQAEPG